jgi:DNA-binding response OmpR family regulator
MISLEIAQIAPTSKAVLSKDLADLDHYGQQQHKVLLLDSNKDIQTMLHYGFSLRSFNMKTMTSGTETLDFLRHRTDWGLPDLIILDRELNDMDGVDVLETIHSERLCSAPIVFLSAKCTEEQILRGLKAGAADYVTKPFSLDIFITKCQKLLGVQ